MLFTGVQLWKRIPVGKFDKATATSISMNINRGIIGDRTGMSKRRYICIGRARSDTKVSVNIVKGNY